MATKYRGIPSVEKILSHPKVKSLSNIYSHDVLVSIIRESLSRIREDIQDSKDVPNPVSYTHLTLPTNREV